MSKQTKMLLKITLIKEKVISKW